MLTSLFTGTSGVKANMTALSVIGNNIANMNTYGFKESQPYFADVLAQNLSGASSSGEIGMGVVLGAVDQNFTQGVFETTSNALDLAINGNGYFMVKDQAGTNYYTRAGHFSLDKDGNILNSEGLLLQGYQADAEGNILNTTGNLQVLATTIPPKASALVTMGANLNSGSEIPAAFDVNDPVTTSNFSTGVTVYDSLGNSHPVTVYFRKSTEATTGNSWEWFAVIDAADAASGTREISAQGTLGFTPTGALDTESAITYPTGGFDFSGGAAEDQAIALDFGTSIADGGTGVDGVTQYGSSSGVGSIQQDGYMSGNLQGIAFNKDGTLTGAFTNGMVRSLGQVALATFPAPSGLTSAGEMRFEESMDSGTPIVGKPGNQGIGEVTSNALELSNVDLAEEFVKMIIAQRGFQANSKVITTSDEVLAELVNIKR